MLAVLAPQLSAEIVKRIGPPVRCPQPISKRPTDSNHFVRTQLQVTTEILPRIHIPFAIYVALSSPSGVMRILETAPFPAEGFCAFTSFASKPQLAG